MTPPGIRTTSPPLTLARTLRRVHLVCALIAVSLTGGSLMIVGMIRLQALENHNLQLLARSIAYSAEAAVVFNDQRAALDSIARIASSDEVESVSVFDIHGGRLATWQRTRNDSHEKIWGLVDRLPWRSAVAVPILNEGVPVGEIRLHGSPNGLLAFIVTGFLWIAAGMALSVASTLYLSRRIFNRITIPLGELARVTHQVRSARSFGQRVPPAHITELNDLASDFNALLEQLEKWEAGMQLENKSLAHQATHDSLTGLPNRTLFERRLAHEVERATRDKQRFAVLFLDADRFKEVNDTMGHAAGDKVLVAVAARVREQLRAGDLVARLGGDEFAALLSPLRDAEDASRVAWNIAVAMREPIVFDDGTTVMSSVSVGMAVYPDDALDGIGLIRAADIAMYLAKARGNKEWRYNAAGLRGRMVHFNE
jgi:diguanylate cyclase (GGDEF)-like protein|uniref:diguanylate cyclase n=1 Tax=Caballeronia sp. LjRoot34 TaxID=3342325 RepID=UPI003F4FF9E6